MYMLVVDFDIQRAEQFHANQLSLKKIDRKRDMEIDDNDAVHNKTAFGTDIDWCSCSYYEC